MYLCQAIALQRTLCEDQVNVQGNERMYTNL